ncbi:AMP-binding protein [Campylobacter sp. 9BO]|uniref:AMP-binding protein n=1 Tax=Campylobacter sp. 9BO TaxID=3424759 RepID=UPI003D32E794
MINLEKYNDKISRAVRFLNDEKPKNIEIYIEDSDEFIIAFFAALALDLKPLVLSTNLAQDGAYFINDLNKILSKDGLEFELKDDAIFYLKTSGSSGEAKLIQKTLLQMKKEALALANNIKFGDEFLASVSHQHMFGLTFKIFLPLVLGAKIEPKFLNYPEFIYEKDLKNKTLISSPTLLKALLQSPKRTKLKDLKNIICAGAKLEQDLASELKTLTSYINIYGSTETGVVASDNGSGLSSFDGVSVTVDEKSCLVVKSSPWCEYFVTSDVAKINGQNIELLGRFDRILKINEKRISLDVLEALIRAHEFVDECICGLSDAKADRISVVFVLSELGSQNFREYGKKGVCDALKLHLKDEYQNNVRHFKIVSKIPKNSQGKIQKQDFYKLLKQNETFEFMQISLSQDRAVFSADIKPSLFYFDGHFVDFALVPGFIQLECIQKLAGALNINLTQTEMIEAVKFSGFLRPNDKAIFELWIKNEKLYFSINNGEKICASGRICIG